jgi:hypothetical protein
VLIKAGLKPMPKKKKILRASGVQNITTPSSNTIQRIGIVAALLLVAFFLTA